MRAMGGIVNLLGERVDAELLVNMRRAIDGFGRGQWRADVYGKVGLLFGGGFDQPCECKGAGNKTAVVMLDGDANISCRELAEKYFACGEDFLTDLAGAFSLTLYDKEQGKLIIARSRGRLAPFYYCVSEKRLAFADSKNGLLPLADNPESICELEEGSAALIDFGSFALVNF